jgi:hypothetical protein
MPKLKNGHIPQVLATEYASYRDTVTRELSLKLADVEERSGSRPLVLYDPMAGTAPLLPLAERRGYTAQFNDLNSLHLYINAAKTLRSYRAFKNIGHNELLSIVCGIAPGLDRCRRTATEKWIEDSVLERLAHAWKRTTEQSKPIAVLTKAVLLLAVRNFSSFVRTKNPTWLKPGGLRSNVSAKEAFRPAIKRLDNFYQDAYANHGPVKGGYITLTDYDASRSGPEHEVDVVVTSPPFCNRVDWDRLYAPEHFFLSAVGVWHTRTEFLGTTAVDKYRDFESDFEFVTKRSSYLRRFPKEVRERQIKNEQQSDYYVKYYTRYFGGLFRVFDMAVRALGNGNAGVYFVTQENVHRGLLIEIGKALAEFLSSQGLRSMPLDTWERHHLGLQNISRQHTLVAPKQRECIWHAVQKS